MGVVLSLTMSFLAGCGEEIGWRGFLHGELRALVFWKNATITGLFWLGWHIPLLAVGYGYPQHPGLGVLFLSVHVMISAYGHGYLRERSGSSLVAGLFHGTTEAAALLAVAPLTGGSDVTTGIGSVTWIAADALIVAGLLAYDAFLAHPPSPSVSAPPPRDGKQRRVRTDTERCMVVSVGTAARRPHRRWRGPFVRHSVSRNEPSRAHIP